MATLLQSSRLQGRHTLFYARTSSGVYQPLPTQAGGVIASQVLPSFQFRLDDLYRQPHWETLVEDAVYQGFVFPAYQTERERANQAEQHLLQERQQLYQVEQTLMQAEQAAATSKASTLTLLRQSLAHRSPWRLLITPPLDGASNMALDEAILHALADGSGQPTLRFYQWQPPCLSLGFGQRYREVDEAACQKFAYTWLRRPTGGRAILHTDELTYSIVVPQDDPRVAGDLIHSYRNLSRGLLLGLQNLGAVAVQADKSRQENKQQGVACFDRPSHYEVTLNGKKLVGSAQLRRRGTVLQHGTLPLRGDITRIFDVLHLSEAEKSIARQALPAQATTLEAEIKQPVSFEQAAEALADGFAQTLNLTLAPGDLSQQEETLLAHFRAAQYANDSWNKRR